MSKFINFKKIIFSLFLLSFSFSSAFLMSNFNFNNMPPEILLQIISELDNPKDLYRILNVNQKFRTTALYKFGHLDLQNSNITDNQLACLLRRFPKIRSINLRCCKTVTDVGLIAIANNCPDLQLLNISDHNITDEVLIAIANNCHELKSLTVRALGDSNSGLIAIANNCPALQSLAIIECMSVTDEVLALFAKNCPNIQSLDLRFCSQLTNNTLKAFADNHINLKYLNIQNVFPMSDLGLTFITESIAKLKSLNIAGCKVTDSGLRYIANNCPELESLNISMSRDRISLDGLTLIANNCHNLQSLDASFCEIANNDLKNLALKWPNLKILKGRYDDLSWILPFRESNKEYYARLMV